jgi:hypothetical protein
VGILPAFFVAEVAKLATSATFFVGHTEKTTRAQQHNPADAQDTLAAAAPLPIHESHGSPTPSLSFRAPAKNLTVALH